MSARTIDVLLVDDDAADCRLVKLVLSDSVQGVQFRVETAPSLAAATECLGQGRYDVILLDLGLPDSHGISTVQQMQRANSNTPIVVLTGLTDEEMGLKAIKSGAQDFVIKGESLQHALVRIILYAIERKQTEEELKEAKRAAETASESKSQFLANMSHEIRTPMNAIIGFSDILADEDLTDQQKDYVCTILNSAKNLLQIINDILDFSKIESGKFEVDIGECDVKQLLVSTHSLMQQLAKEKGIAFEIKQVGALPAKISTDNLRLQQCLVNLINNGIKFTDEGHVHLSVSMEHRDDGACMRFDVEDTGIGVPAEKQKDIFESFIQANGGTSRRHGGTGLGLAISKQFASLLGGQINLSSEEGSGSVFSLLIPVGLDVSQQLVLGQDEISGETNEAEKAKEPEKLSGYILVAEDVRTNQMLIKSLLHQLGLEVTIANDGNEVVEKALGQKYDLILMDIQMPHMNGYEATAALRKVGITTPIVALTAHAMRGDDQKCIEAGCDGYLTKPIDRRDLQATVQKYLSASKETACGETACKEAEAAELSASVSTKPGGDQGESAEVAISREQLIERLGSAHVLREIVSIFLEDSQEQIDQLSAAVQSGDGQAIWQCAHGIRGASGNIGAQRLSDLAGELEHIGKEGDLEGSSLLLETLKAELDKVVALLNQPDWLETSAGEKVAT